MLKEITAPNAGRITEPLTYLPKWQQVVNRLFKELEYPSPDYEMLNNFVNKKFEYQIDKKDYWKAPGQFAADGGGDCEDFAIYKFFSLNLPKYIAVGEDKGERHAVCVIYAHDRDDWVVLDCRTNNIVTWQGYLKEFTPVYLCDLDGVYI